MLSRLILQILDKNPTVLRRGEDLKEIQSQLAYEGPDRVKALSKALLRIINLQNDRLFIVLDQPDLCELAQIHKKAEWSAFKLCFTWWREQSRT
jgi:hypothetical protein